MHGADDGLQKRSEGSRSRSRSPRRRHKRHRYRKSRSRSRTPKIFVNPTFGIQQPNIPVQGSSYQPMGYSASQLLQTNNFLESEVARLKHELMNEQNRMQMTLQQSSMWSSEIRNLTNQKANIERRCNELTGERRRLLETINEQKDKFSGIETMASVLQRDLHAMSGKLEEKEEESRTFEYQLDLMKQQIDALNQRNASLKMKCESLVSVNRQQQEEIDNGKKFVDESRINVEKMEADVQCANLEIKRLIKELDVTTENELMWQKEKKNLESIIAKKDDDIRLANFRATQTANISESKIKQLESKLRNEKPTFQAELAMEAIYQVLETIKKTYDAQLGKLEDEIEQLKASHDEEEKGDSNIEELPEYLKTPMKPSRYIKTEICGNENIARPARPVSGPPVDSPIQWHRLRSLIPPSAEMPKIFNEVFPDMGNGKELRDISEYSHEVGRIVPSSSISHHSLLTNSCESSGSSEDVIDGVLPNKRVKTECSDSSQEVTGHPKPQSAEISEEDLLADNGDRYSPIQDIESIEKQIFGET